MPKESIREISRDVTYTSKNGRIIKRTVIHEIVGNAKWIEGDDNPSLNEFRDTILNKDENASKDGYVKETKTSTVS